MEKTAMNQMLEELIAHEWEIPMTLIVKAKELVQVEKEQIINACIHTASKLSDVGLSDITINGEIELAEQYYNETYGKE